MFLRTITIKGVTRLYFYESYYKDGKTKQKCVENLGRLDELRKQFADPVSHFKKIAEERTIQKQSSLKTSVTINLASSMDIKEDNLKNIGYVILKELYKQLELDKFWKNILKKTSIKYDAEAVFRLLVFSRILYPGSKMDSFNKKHVYI